MFTDLVKATRTIRNFDPSVRIAAEDLEGFIELCRYTPATANKQPLKFAYACTREACEKIFPLLGWAGYLTDKPPYDGNVPAAYILICCDTNIMKDPEVDVGICAQTIVLAAAEKGIGACMLGSINKDKLAEYFSLPEGVLPRLIVALGKAKETVEIVDAVDGEIKYYRDGKEKNIVPKRPLSEIMLPEMKR